MQGDLVAFLITLIFLFVFWSNRKYTKTENYYAMKEPGLNWLRDFIGVWNKNKETIVINHFHRTLIKLTYRREANNGQILVRNFPPLRIIPLEETENSKKIKVISSDGKFRFSPVVMQVQGTELIVNGKIYRQGKKASFV